MISEVMQASRINEVFSDRLITQLDLAYICLDHSMIVQNTSANIEKFGFPSIPFGSNVTDHIDFMVGMDTHSELHFSIVKSPSGKPLSIRFMPDDDGMTVVIIDASSVFEQRQALQQQANENELLLNKQKKLMRQLAEASRLQSSFLSGVSHEFRTPLSSIIGYTNLLNRHADFFADQLPQAAQYLSAIRRSSGHLLSLVENLLDHGKLDSGEIVLNPKVTNLVQLFDDVSILLYPLTATKNIEFSVTHDFAEPSMALVDDSRLRQCLINIIGNAIKFTDQGSVKVDVSWQQDQLNICVKDTGIGISQDNIQKTLMPFWQAPDTGKAGTGLGLTITQRIIDLMGGELNIVSELNEGTDVTFDLIVPRVAASEIEEKHLTETPNQSFTMLLAEDDDDIAELLTFLLEEKGVNVKRVENGALAVELSERTKFDLILMDIHMPILGGYEAIQQIRSRGDDVPIIVMSATPVDTNQTRAEQLDCDGYLLKPVDVDDILQLAKQVLTTQ